jgi:hypothetical protein
MKLLHFRRRSGAALVTALACSAIILGIGYTTYQSIQTKYRSIHQTASWKEALLTAEGGVEMAMNEIRKTLYDAPNAFAGWEKSADEIAAASTAPGATAGNMTYWMSSNAILREGEGGLESWARVTVDAPRSLVDRRGEKWYRIRSLGIADLPGPTMVAGEKQDLRLRKYDFLIDRRSGRNLAKPQASRPQASRMLETIAKPVGAFPLAVLGVGSVDMNNHNIQIDSYDSRDAAKSTNGGYDPAKRQESGDVGTNGKVINAGGAHIYGDVYTNKGTVLGAENVSGDVINDFYKEIIPVQRPKTVADSGTPLFVTGGATFVATPDVPSNYQLSSLTLNGANDVLYISGAADKSDTYCQIVVTGDINVTGGNAQIKLAPGVHVRIFVQGNATIAGTGFINPNSPLALQIYGCDRPKLADGSPASYGTMKIAGNGGFCGAVYAPNYNLEIVGGGTGQNIFGAFVANTVFMNGVQAIHYDEALADGGLITDYRIVSWFEDER